MSYPQPPSPGESAQPTSGAVGRQPPPLTAPTPAYSPFPTRPRRPAGIIIAAIGLFAIGVGYLVPAIVSGVSMYHMGSLVAENNLHFAVILPYVSSLLIDLTMVIASVVAGILVVMNKSIGRSLGFVVAGAAVLMACGTASQGLAMMVAHGSEVAVGMVGVVLFAMLIAVAVAVIAMLAPRGVEEWMRFKADGDGSGLMPGPQPVPVPPGRAAGPVGVPPADRPSS